MKTNMLFGKTLASLESTLNLRSMNQKLIVSNIANMDTPNFKAFKMMMDEEMQTASAASAPLSMTRTQPGHLVTTPAAVDLERVERVENDPMSLRGDGNTVELDQEMTNLAENSLLYNAATRIVATKFRFLKDAIKGGQ
jgi:flagellar basal-body rod protein FlgB